MAHLSVEHAEAFKRYLDASNQSKSTLGARPTYGFSFVISSDSHEQLKQDCVSAFNAGSASIDNSINSFVSAELSRRSSISMQELATQRLLNPDNPAPLFSYNQTTHFPTLFVPQIQFLDNVSIYCIKKIDHLTKLRDATDNWSRWVQDVYKYYTKGVMGDSTIELYDVVRNDVLGDEDPESIKHSNILASLNEVEAQKLVKNVSLTAKAVEDNKHKQVMNAKAALEDLYSAVRNNLFEGALAKLNEKINGYAITSRYAKTQADVLRAKMGMYSGNANFTRNPTTGQITYVPPRQPSSAFPRLFPR